MSFWPKIFCEYVPSLNGFHFYLFFTFSGVLYFKSQKSDIWPYFFSTNVEYVRQSGGEHFKAGWRVIFLFVKNIVRSCFSSALSLSLSSFILAPVLNHSFGISSFVIIKLGQQNHTPAKLNDGLWKSYINEIVLALYFLGYS